MLALPRAAPVTIDSTPTELSARGVLEALLVEALATSPCHILFSGGRDSSALLALALHLARQHGLPEPVPVTVRHPEAPESDETWWQELVVEHLRPRDHIVLEFRTEQRLLGDAAVAALERHGPVWPESVQLHGAIYRHLDRGTIVTGEGGDAFLTGHRMGAIRDGLMLRRPRRRNIRGAMHAARPASRRRRELDTQVGEFTPPWLSPPAAVEYRRQAVAMSADPLRWDVATRSLLRTRPMSVFIANVEAAITEFGSRPLTPFTDPLFVEALANEAGPFGWGSRTAIFRRLFHDVLPDRVLRRTSKASFNSTRWGPEERAFAAAWDGTGLDPDWIDAEELREAWLADDPHPAADFLLHVAWAHAQGVATVPQEWL